MSPTKDLKETGPLWTTCLPEIWAIWPQSCREEKTPPCRIHSFVPGLNIGEIRDLIEDLVGSHYESIPDWLDRIERLKRMDAEEVRALYLLYWLK